MWISHRGARRRVVPSAPGRAPRAVPAGDRQPVSPGSHQPRWVPLPGHSHAERVADGLIRAEDKLRTEDGSWELQICVCLFTTNTRARVAAKSNGTPRHTQGNRVLKTAHSKMSQRIRVPYFRRIFQLRFTCQTPKASSAPGEYYLGKGPYYIFPRGQISGCYCPVL